MYCGIRWAVSTQRPPHTICPCRSVRVDYPGRWWCRKNTPCTSLDCVSSKKPRWCSRLHWHLLKICPNIAVSEAACCVDSGRPSKLEGRPSSARTTRTARTLFFNGCWCCTSEDRFIDRLVLCYLEEMRQQWTWLTYQRSLFFFKTTASFQFLCLFIKMQTAESCQHLTFSQGFCGKWDFNYAFIKKFNE